MMPTTAVARNRIAGGVFAVALLFTVVMANLPYRYVHRDGLWYGRQFGSNDEMDFDGGSQPTMAGWPLRYWIRYQSDGQSDSVDRYWSAPRLAINGLLGLLAAGMVYAFTQLRRRAIESAKNRQMLRAVFDVVIALGILLSPVMLYLLNYQQTKSHRELARRIAKSGLVYMSCELPESIADRVPSAWVSSLMRIRVVRLKQPDNQIVESTVKIPSLRGLWLGGERYDSSSLEPLRERVHLARLHINRRELTDEDIRTISQLRWLKHLNLAQTNLNGRLLRGLDQLDGLRSVDLTRTPLNLADLGKPAWSDTVRTLWLSRPRTGSGATLSIDGWPELKTISVSRWSVTLNPSTLELRLSNLPKLESLFINRVQRHALIGCNLPRFSTIDENDDSLKFSLREQSRGIPGFTWFSELQLDGVPSLKRLICHATDLRSISIRNAPRLRTLELGSFTVFGDGTAKVSSPDVEDVQSWIDSLGKSDGPLIVELNALPLKGVDLSPLASNVRLQELGLSYTDVSYDQLRDLAGMKQLTRIELGGCLLKDDQLSWLFETFPNLKQLQMDVSEVKDFDLAAAPNLELMRVTPFEKIRRFRLVDRPRLDSWFRLDRAPERLEIRNVQSLGGLEVREPWPQDATLTGLRDLRSFVAGGPEVDDHVVDALLACRSLDQLTLAYPSVSAEKLGEIGQLTGLSSIALPGADVNDTVTQNWRQIRMLNNVNLDDTRVSAETLLWFSQINSLRNLSINRVPLNDNASRTLGLLVQLSRLEIADTAVRTEYLMPILAEDIIERLDLSGNTIDSPLIDALAKCTSLRRLKLDRCKLSKEHVKQLLASNPRLLIDLGSDLGKLGPEIAKELETRRQLGSEDSFFATRVAIESYPSFALSLAIGDFIVLGRMPKNWSGPLDLNSFRTTDLSFAP